jgi:hypothetical protein
MKPALAFLSALLLLGCGSGETKSPEPRDADVRETMSQGNTLKAGKRAAEQIRQIDADRQKGMEEALDK